MVVLAKDPFEVDVDQIPAIEVEKTIVGGKVVFEEQGHFSQS